jgi:hypothetical protein
LCCSEADFAGQQGCWQSITTCRRRSPRLRFPPAPTDAVGCSTAS